MNTVHKLYTVLVIVAITSILGCETPTHNSSTATEHTSTPALKIAVVKVDSLQTGYTHVADELKRLEENFQAAQVNFKKMEDSFRREVQILQNQMQQGLLAPNKIQSEQQRLARKEQEIAQQQQVAINSIQQDQMKLQADFSERVKSILEEIQEEYDYDLVMNQGTGSSLLLSNDAFDITPMVLERLNSTSATTEKDSIK